MRINSIGSFVLVLVIQHHIVAQFDAARGLVVNLDKSNREDISF